MNQPHPHRNSAAPRNPVRVLYEDNHCLAVLKPAGILTAGDRTGDPSLVEIVREYLRAKYHKPGNVFVGVVHRLDRPVGGVVLFARTSKAASRLSAQFRSGRVEKVYQAIVEGRVMKTEGELASRLVKDRRRNVVRSTGDTGTTAKNSSLLFKRLQTVGGDTLLEIRPRTGRSHQIRVQLAEAGHPILGDRKYGSRRTFRGGIALRAITLTFEHPVRKVPVTVRIAPDLI